MVQIFRYYTQKIEYFRIRIRVEVNPYVGEIFTRIFYSLSERRCVYVEKIRNLILCTWHCALTPFRSVVVLSATFLRPFVRKKIYQKVKFLAFSPPTYCRALLNLGGK